MSESITRPNGKTYRPRKAPEIGYFASNEDEPVSDVVIWGTHDLAVARPLAEEALAALNVDEFDAELRWGGEPKLDWYATIPLGTDEDGSSMLVGYRRDPEKGRACIVFPLTYVDLIEERLEQLRPEIFVERRRQIDEEGHTLAGDVGKTRELFAASRCYLNEAGRRLGGLPPAEKPSSLWPWAARYWKPTVDIDRMIIKAGALRLAATEASEAERRAKADQ